MGLWIPPLDTWSEGVSLGNLSSWIFWPGMLFPAVQSCCYRAPPSSLLHSKSDPMVLHVKPAHSKDFAMQSSYAGVTTMEDLTQGSTIVWSSLSNHRPHAREARDLNKELATRARYKYWLPEVRGFSRGIFPRGFPDQKCFVLPFRHAKFSSKFFGPGYTDAVSASYFC